MRQQIISEPNFVLAIRPMEGEKKGIFGGVVRMFIKTLVFAKAQGGIVCVFFSRGSKKIRGQFAAEHDSCCGSVEPPLTGILPNHSYFGIIINEES